MPSPFEAEIRELLAALRDPEQVAEDLLRRWKKNLLSAEEQRDSAEFMVASGQSSKFLRFVTRLAEARLALPWAAIAEAIGRSRVKPDESELEAIFKGADEQNANEELVRSRQLDLWSRRFQELRGEKERQRLDKLEQRKDELMDRLQFLRANRMVGQEKEVLEEFQALAPADPEVQRERESYEMRWARDVLARRTSVEQSTAEDLARRADRLTPEQEATKTLLVAQSLERAKKDPARAYDLALNLHFMDCNNEAIEVLKLAPASPSADWLRIELMLLARRYVDALSEASRLEALYATEPEAAFAVTYARARALKGLGQVELAIDLLRSLVRVRPSYKSARSLLMDWSGGDE